MSLPGCDIAFIFAAATAYKFGGHAMVMTDRAVRDAARGMLPLDLETIEDYIDLARPGSGEYALDGVSSGVIARAILAAIMPSRTPQSARCPECGSFDVTDFEAYDDEGVPAWKCRDCEWWTLGNPCVPPHGPGDGIY